MSFHQGLHCLLRQIDIQRKKYDISYFENYTPSLYTIDHSDFIVCSFIENSIGPKRVKPMYSRNR